jgi:acyl carrier protein
MEADRLFGRVVGELVLAVALCTGCDDSPSAGPLAQPAAPSSRPADAAATQAAGDPAPPAANDSVEAEVTRIVAELLEVPPVRVTPGADLSRDLKADDLARVELVMKLEEHFKIRIRENEADRARTVGQVTDLVRAKTK